MTYRDRAALIFVLVFAITIWLRTENILSRFQGVRGAKANFSGVSFPPEVLIDDARFHSEHWIYTNGSNLPNSAKFTFHSLTWNQNPDGLRGAHCDAGVRSKNAFVGVVYSYFHLSAKFRYCCGGLPRINYGNTNPINFENLSSSVRRSHNVWVFRWITYSIAYINGLDSYPSPLIKLEIVNGSLKGSARLFNRRFSCFFSGAGLATQPIYSVVYSLAHAAGAIREIASRSRVLLRSISTYFSRSNQSFGLLGSGIVIPPDRVPLSYSKSSYYKGEEQFDMPICAGLPQITKPILSAIAWFCGFILIGLFLIGILMSFGVQNVSPSERFIIAGWTFACGIFGFWIIHFSVNL